MSNSSLEPTQKSSDPCVEIKALLLAHGVHIRKLIGSGAYAKVRLAWNDREDQLIAVKEIDRSSNSEFVRKFLPREIDIVRRLEHKNIIKVFDIIEMGAYICFLEEFGSRGDLLSLIKKEKRLEEEKGKFIFRQMVDALQYLEQMRVVHRDLKCENIVFDDCDNIKISDFGFSRYMLPGEKSRTFCGSRAYAAPEILRSQPYSGFGVDIWSAGVILYVMLVGLMPYDETKPRKMLEKQMRHRLSFPSRVNLTFEAKILIFDMLHPQPDKRKQCKDIIQTNWLKDTPYRVLSSKTTHSREDSFSPTTYSENARAGNSVAKKPDITAARLQT
ncbi:hypothetical protein AB6A40_008663 [Gnathostoma spinigerum]|uniref:Protein kinase domain-containing protein n=1 Tax=Gnathostoma spinigerum TaxID=75299 RepID=A0ABD6EUU4_9BILA